MGFTQTPEGQAISPTTQVEMLGALLDSLHADAVDFVANNSGGLVAQLFVAKYPQRVRTLLLTNCDVDENSPPPPFLPFIEVAKKRRFRGPPPRSAAQRQRAGAVGERLGRAGVHLSGKTCGRHH